MIKIKRKITCIVLIIVFISCQENRVQDKGIADTLRYGSYHKDLGTKDYFAFRILEANNDSVLTRFVNHHDYHVRFEMKRLEKYILDVKLVKGGTLIPSEENDSYFLKVNAPRDLDHLEFDFKVDLQQDSIIIQYRDWTDTTKMAYEDTYIGFKGLGTYTISLRND